MCFCLVIWPYNAWTDLNEKLVCSFIMSFLCDQSLEQVEQGKKSREKQRKGNSSCDVFCIILLMDMEIKNGCKGNQ